MYPLFQITMYMKITLKNVFIIFITCLFFCSCIILNPKDTDNNICLEVKTNIKLSDSNFELYCRNLPAENLWNESLQFSDLSKLELQGEEFIPVFFVFVNNNYTMTEGNFQINTPR